MLNSTIVYCCNTSHDVVLHRMVGALEAADNSVAVRWYVHLVYIVYKL